MWFESQTSWKRNPDNWKYDIGIYFDASRSISISCSLEIKKTESKTKLLWFEQWNEESTDGNDEPENHQEALALTCFWFLFFFYIFFFVYILKGSFSMLIISNSRHFFFLRFFQFLFRWFILVYIYYWLCFIFHLSKWRLCRLHLIPFVLSFFKIIIGRWFVISVVIYLWRCAHSMSSM